MAILGIPIAALKAITGELVQANHHWDQMTSKLDAIPTQAIQLWMNKDSKELGLDVPRPLTGGYVEPYSSLTDFSPLLERENWPESDNVRFLMYTCNAQKRVQGETKAQALERARANAVNLLTKHAKPLFPKGTINGGQELDWDLLVAPESVKGVDRLDHQYIRANIDPWERYTLSEPNTMQYRIKTDGTPFEHLVITGTWIDSGFNLGCVETGVISGMQAARVLTGVPKHIIGEDDRGVQAIE